MATSFSTDTGISALPEIDQKKYPEVWAELVRIRQALQILQEAIDRVVVSGVGIPAGGAAGTVLTKVTSTDFDVTWV